MKFDSPLFDRIRVKPSEDRRRSPDAPCCDWKGCDNAATHRAPKARPRENEHWRFCLEHVREYNHSYNYFSGMSDDAVLKYQKDAITGHRPTWKMGTGNHPGPSSAPTPRAIRSMCSASSVRGRRPRRPSRRAPSATPSARPCTSWPRCRRRQGRDQGEVQDAGEAPSSRRQQRRPRAPKTNCARSSRPTIILKSTGMLK